MHQEAVDLLLRWGADEELVDGSGSLRIDQRLH